MNVRSALVILTVGASLFATAHAHDLPKVIFTATTESVTGPESVQAGYVNLALENQDEGMRALGIFRLKDGADVARAKNLTVRALSGEEVRPEEEKALTDGFYGGAVFVEPATRKEVGVALVPGTYVVYADGITDEGLTLTPDYVTTLTVTPHAYSSAELPTPDYTVKMVDHAFAFPADIRAGKHLFRVENLGHQEHMMFVSKLLPGKTLEDVMALFEDESDPTTVMEEETFGVHGVSPGLFNDAVFDLEPGNYAAVCFVTDPESGLPHAMLGMTQVFTVTD